MTDMIRREVLGGMAAGVGAASLAGPAAAQTVKWSSGTERPKTPAPAGAVDCHHHIYDGRFQPAAGMAPFPGDATVADYRTLQARIGTVRNVVIQPSTYGTDNRLLLEALGQFGAAARGVAVVDTGVTDAELRRLYDAGVRGIRFNLVQAGATTADMLEPLARRVAPLGMHVQLHLTGDQLLPLGDVLQRLPAPIVFDHLGRIPQPAGIHHPAFTLIRGLLEKGRTWVKLSGAYQDTKVGPPGYGDTVELARAFVSAAPERMVWGSDWPHPTERNTKPDDALLFDILASWVPDEAQRNRILVRNPEELYGFAPV